MKIVIVLALLAIVPLCEAATASRRRRGTPSPTPNDRDSGGSTVWASTCYSGYCSNQCNNYGSCRNRCYERRCTSSTWEVYGSLQLSHFNCLTSSHEEAIRMALANKLDILIQSVGIHSVSDSCAGDDVAVDVLKNVTVYYELSGLASSTATKKVSNIETISLDPSALQSRLVIELGSANANPTYDTDFTITASLGTSSEYSHAVNTAGRQNSIGMGVFALCAIITGQLLVFPTVL